MEPNKKIIEIEFEFNSYLINNDKIISFFNTNILSDEIVYKDNDKNFHQIIQKYNNKNNKNNNYEKSN